MHRCVDLSIDVGSCLAGRVRKRLHRCAHLFNAPGVSAGNLGTEETRPRHAGPDGPDVESRAASGTRPSPSSQLSPTPLPGGQDTYSFGLALSHRALGLIWASWAAHLS